MFRKSHKGKDIDSVYEIQASVIVALKLGSRNDLSQGNDIFVFQNEIYVAGMTYLVVETR
jgi:hypothetical protein